MPPMIWKLLPDLAVLIPDRLKPYAKAVVVGVLALVYVLATYTGLVDSAHATKLYGTILLVAGALGVLGTSNVPNTPTAKQRAKRKRPA